MFDMFTTCQHSSAKCGEEVQSNRAVAHFSGSCKKRAPHTQVLPWNGDNNFQPGRGKCFVTLPHFLSQESKPWFQPCSHLRDGWRRGNDYELLDVGTKPPPHSTNTTLPTPEPIATRKIDKACVYQSAL